MVYIFDNVLATLTYLVCARKVLKDVLVIILFY